MSVTLKNAPAVIVEFKAPRGAGHVKDGEQPTKLRLVTIEVDVTDDEHQKAIGEVFPGFDMALKAAAGANDQGSKSSAFVWTVAKKLPNITITVRNKVDGIVLSGVNVKVKSKPVLRVALGVEKVLMPITIACPMDDATLKSVVDYIDHDVIVDFTTSQMDVADVPQSGTAESPEAAKKKGKKNKSQITLVGAGDTGTDG